MAEGFILAQRQARSEKQNECQLALAFASHGKAKSKSRNSVFIHSTALLIHCKKRDSPARIPLSTAFSRGQLPEAQNSCTQSFGSFSQFLQGKALLHRKKAVVTRPRNAKGSLKSPLGGTDGRKRPNKILGSVQGPDF